MARGGPPGVSVRVVAAVLLAQAVVITAVILALVDGLPGGGEEDGGSAPPRAARAPADVPRPTVDRFDAARAMALLRDQVRRGPRPAGSPALRRLAVRLRAALPAGRFEAVPGHPGLRNVVGMLPGRRPAVLVGAHYDTQPVPRGFVGANDGAAGTAAVVELARALAAEPAPAGAREVRFVLFDGEELPAARSSSGDFARYGLRGSKAYARAHARDIRWMVLLDYVAGRDVRLPREATSNRALWQRLRRAAARVGTAALFPPRTQLAIIDDHTPFLSAGVPAVDLIDWRYPARNTLRDRLDQVSERSLDAVGESVLELLLELRRP